MTKSMEMKRMDRIIAFDVETPNFNNDRICSIGITVIENGEIVQSQHFLVNPECTFDPRNIQIHGITPADVAEAPTFPEIWNIIGTLFRTNLVVAHNAVFDLCVLRKALQAYGISESLVYYIDTLTIARSVIKETDNYRLPTLCEWFDIPLDHHNAGSDSWACGKLLCRLLKAESELDRYIKAYSLEVIDRPSTMHAPNRLSANNQALLTLSGILSGITCDNVLVEAEVDYLQKWMDDNAALKGNYPYDKIYSTLTSAMADGILEQAELDDMLRIFKQVTDPVKESSCSCERLDITGKSICLSGEFDCGSKSVIGEKLVSHGASIHTMVTQKTDILLVGGQGSAVWSAGNYGTKVKKALELQDKGISILLMREADFFASLEG
jgi:DNA polymerase III epsilon subunit-like protein